MVFNLRKSHLNLKKAQGLVDHLKSRLRSPTFWTTAYYCEIRVRLPLDLQ